MRRPFLRCPVCGRRVSSADAACPEHGALEAPDADVDSSRIDLIAPAPFPGYRLLRHVASGGFGTIFAAEPQDGGRVVAIKVARAGRADARAYLRSEIEILGAIGPPHVPALHEHGELADGTPYLIMEYLDAPPLSHLLATQAEPITIERAVSLALSILRALEAVHAAGYVHGDLKPENIVVDDREAKLLDFGLATSLSQARESGSEGPAGTPEYMSPEQCEGRDDLDARADLYAMGVILHEMIAGRPPFWGPGAVVRESHRSRRPPRLSTTTGGRALPDALDELVATCLAKLPRDRFESAAALRASLEAVQRELASSARETPPPAPPRERGGEPDRPPSPSPHAGRGWGGVSEPDPATSERLTLGLIFFDAEAEATVVAAKIRAFGGQVGRSSGGRYVAIFGHELADNPARLALRGAEQVLRVGLCERLRVDLAPVVVQPRRDGSRRFFSPLFTRAERFPSADDPPGLALSPAAAAVLSAVATPPPAGPTLDPAPGASPLLGRDAVLDALLEGARRAACGALASVVSVVADPGHGKSHLCRLLVERLGELGVADVVDLVAREPALGDVDHTLAELLRRLLALPAAAPPGGHELLRERLGPAGAELASVVALALGWGPSDTTGGGGPSTLRRLEAAPGALRSALTLAAGDALRRRAATRPVFVVLDDAHFASDMVLSALEYAALAEAQAPVWICALARPAFEQLRPAWGERAGHREAHHLGPLDPESAADLCRRLLLPVESAPASAVRRLVERAQAIPLLLVELMRGLRHQGIVRRDPRGEGWYLATDELDRLPDLPIIEWLARSEMDALAPALRGHARLLALLGERVTVAEIAWILRRLEEQGGDLDELPLDPRIGTERLLAAGILVQDGEGCVGFRHALVREAVARAIPAAQRRRIHLAAAAHHRDAEGERALAELAYHASEAEMGEVAERAYLELAERARARHAYIDAERLYSRALEQPRTGDTAARCAEHRGRGLMRYRIGRYHDALGDLTRARELAVWLGDAPLEAAILLDEATALDWMYDHTSSAERVEAAAALAPGVRSPLLDARLLLGQGRSLHRFSRNEPAASLLERAAAQASLLGEGAYETLVIALMQLGFILPGLRRLDDARGALDRVIALCEAHGDHVHLAAALNNRGLLSGYLDDEPRMIADLDRSVALARELGQTTLEFSGHFNAGEFLLLMDHADAAEPRIQRALALDRRLSGASGWAVTALLEARRLLHAGDTAAARAAAAAVRERQRAALAQGSADALMAPAEDVLCAMIELATRDAGAAEWDELEARSERFSVGQERIEVIETRAAAAARLGRVAEARRQLGRALALAATIPNAMGARLRRRAAELAGGATGEGP